MDLQKFFSPRSAALVGATEDLRKFGGRCLNRLLNFGYTGTVYPVNPKYQELFGHSCYASVGALPETPDHVGIVVPAEQVLGVLEQCAARGAARPASWARTAMAS